MRIPPDPSPEYRRTHGFPGLDQPGRGTDTHQQTRPLPGLQRESNVTALNGVARASVNRQLLKSSDGSTQDEQHADKHNQPNHDEQANVPSPSEALYLIHHLRQFSILLNHQGIVDPF